MQLATNISYGNRTNKLENVLGGVGRIADGYGHEGETRRNISSKTVTKTEGNQYSYFLSPLHNQQAKHSTMKSNHS